MERHKFFRDKFIELANKKFTDEDVFIRLSYKDKKNKGEIMNNKKFDFDDCFDSFYIELLQFKRRCKRDFGLIMGFDINFRDKAGNFVGGVKSREKSMDEKKTSSNSLIIDCLELADINDLFIQIEEIKKFEKEYKVDCTLNSIKLNKA